MSIAPQAIPTSGRLDDILDRQRCLPKLEKSSDFPRWRLEVLFVAELVKAEHRGDPHSYEPTTGVFIETHLCKMKVLILHALSPVIRDKALDMMKVDDKIEEKVIESNKRGLFYILNTIREACAQVAKERRGRGELGDQGAKQ